MIKAFGHTIGFLVFVTMLVGFANPTFADVPSSSSTTLQVDCDNGQAEACVQVGSVMFAKGQNLYGARGAFQKGCEMGRADACLNLGVMMASGDGGREDDRSASRL